MFLFTRVYVSSNILLTTQVGLMLYWIYFYIHVLKQINTYKHAYRNQICICYKFPIKQILTQILSIEIRSICQILRKTCRVTRGFYLTKDRYCCIIQALRCRLQKSLCYQVSNPSSWSIDLSQGSKAFLEKITFLQIVKISTHYIKNRG